MPESVKQLKDDRIYVDPFLNIPHDMDGVTFWDSLEHIEYNNMIGLLANIPKKTYTFISIPIMKSIATLEDSKHYRPDEHLFYTTYDGFFMLMEDNGFEFIETGRGEIEAGREDIWSFVFRKV